MPANHNESCRSLTYEKSVHGTSWSSTISARLLLQELVTDFIEVSEHLLIAGGPFMILTGRVGQCRGAAQ